MDTAAKKLLREIAHAFAGVRRGSGTTWLEGEELDCHGTPAELAAARALDTDQDWQDVPGSRFEQHSSPVWFLNAEGFRYYLPAIMTWALRSEWRATADNLLHLLNDEERQAWLEESLSLPQLRATADWVWYTTAAAPIKDGWIAELRQYWDRYRRDAEI